MQFVLFQFFFYLTVIVLKRVIRDVAKTQIVVRPVFLEIHVNQFMLKLGQIVGDVREPRSLVMVQQRNGVGFQEKMGYVNNFKWNKRKQI